MKKKTALDPGSNYQDKNISNLQSTETPRRKKKYEEIKEREKKKHTSVTYIQVNKQKPSTRLLKSMKVDKTYASSCDLRSSAVLGAGCAVETRAEPPNGQN